MTWNLFSKKQPPLKNMVNVFRFKNKKYMHAYLLPRNKQEDEEEINVKYDVHWITQHSNCYDVSDNDAWQEFEFYSIKHGEIVFDGIR